MEDTLVFEKPFAFDEKTTECFDNMLSRSIPNYKTMRDLTTSIGLKSIKPHTNVIDLGSSLGGAIDTYLYKNGALNNYVLNEISVPMREKLKEKYKGWEYSNCVILDNTDLRYGFPNYSASLIQSILTIQFTPIEYRQKIIKEIYNNLLPGGVFLFVEKVLGNDYDIDSRFIDEYYSIKKENGYTQENIASKRKNLEGVLVPITTNWNLELLKSVGFTSIDIYWKCLNFVGFIAIK